MRVQRILIIVCIIVVVLGGAVYLARATTKPIASIQCDPTEQGTYHVHAFLSIVDRGTIHHPPADVGFNLLHLCLYWLHTHDDSGTIHIEAPHPITPTLGQFFAVWGQPLSSSRVASYAVTRSETERVYVGSSLYRDSPAGIYLHNHTVVTIEIGPPFRPPVPGQFPRA